MMLSENPRAAAQESGSGPDSGPGPVGAAGMGSWHPAGQQWWLCQGLTHSAQVQRRLQVG